ncbi:MAG TPA: AIPR family protein, partial [Armatimonadota bacterium]|nr:AIPR family protein [Armatimonadota bacterium]
TLRGEPERFGLYNNGITIVVADFKPQDQNGTFELVEPYVVNGCQTTRTIWEVCQQLLQSGGTGFDSALEDWRQRLQQGVVVTKVVKVGLAGDALLENITRYTNSQNAVREKDFLALTRDFNVWAAQMAERDIYLEVQRGGWDSQRAFQRQHPTVKQFSLYANAFDLLKVYGAGWLREAGIAFGRNAAFAPDGTVFKRIMDDGGEPFDVDDLYAANLLHQSAEFYKFGRGANFASRKQTRFLYYMVVMEILREVMHAVSLPAGRKDITKAFIRLNRPAHEHAKRVLLDYAVNLIDEYLAPEMEDSVFHEPSYADFNHDLNAYLKWEQLGKTDEQSPKFRQLLKSYRRLMERKEPSTGLSQRDIVVDAIKQ